MTRYTYGSGMRGCLYDDGPHDASTIDQAADCLIDTFEDGLYPGEDVRLREDLHGSGIHYFDSPSEAGADYCEVNDLEDDT